MNFEKAVKIAKKVSVLSLSVLFSFLRRIDIEEYRKSLMETPSFIYASADVTCGSHDQVTSTKNGAYK